MSLITSLQKASVLGNSNIMLVLNHIEVLNKKNHKSEVKMQKSVHMEKCK